MLSEEALVKAVKRALLSQSDDGMVKELLVIHERERLSQRFEAINKIHGLALVHETLVSALP